MFDYAKKLAGIWDDICDFFLEANPAYAQVGARQSNLIQTGIWDNPAVYDATYKNMDVWGEARYSSPGVIVDGKLVTTKLTQVNMGVEEFIEHSFYEDWTKTTPPRFTTDMLGNPLSPYHAWNKVTIPRAEGRSFKEKYSWDTAPRWDRLSMETGVYGRMWTTALAKSLPANP
jgi:hydrogenase large subunit